jgi:leader peptidase (prepilin peptidase)/N-methyltransferase
MRPEFELHFICILFLFTLGACLGSFFNVCIRRIPFGKSIILPRSHCPTCLQTIPIQGLIPILGYFLMKKKCSSCGHKISFQYPLVEIITAILTVVVTYTYFTTYDIIHAVSLYPNHYNNYNIAPFLTILWILYTGIILSFIDINHRILPDRMTLPGIFIGFVLSFFNKNVGITNSIIGALLGFGILYLLSKAYIFFRKKEGLGLGDVKYLAFIGAALGWEGVFITLFIASMIGSVLGIIWGLRSGKGLQIEIPFGPFLAIGALITSILGNRILW